MADDELRRAERRWRAEGTPEAEAAYLRAAQRQGQISTIPELERRVVTLTGTFKSTQKAVRDQLRRCGVDVAEFSEATTLLVLGARGGGQRLRRKARELGIEILAEVELLKLLERHELVFGGAGAQLCRAASAGDLGAVDGLLASEPDVDWVDGSGLTGSQGSTALWHAVRGQHTEVIAALLAAGASSTAHQPLVRESIPDYPRDRNRERPGSVLHFAAAQNKPQAIRALVAGGVEVDTLDDCGDTALLVACHQDAVEAVVALLELGADPTRASESQSPKVSARKRSDRVTPFRLARSASVLRALLAAGVTPSLVPQRNLELTRLLLEAGADVNQVHFGRTPLMLALRDGDREKALLLLECGADPEGSGAPRDQRTPPLIAATRLGDVELVEALLARGGRAHLDQALAEACGDRGATSTIPSLELARLLLDAGATPNVVGCWSRQPPLSLAASLGWREGLELLLDADADLNARDAKGLSAARHAARAGHPKIVELLRTRGADVTGAEPWTPGDRVGCGERHGTVRGVGGAQTLQKLDVAWDDGASSSLLASEVELLGEPRRAPPQPETHELEPGQRVRHPLHGPGQLESVVERKASVAFDDGQQRTLPVTFLKPLEP